MKHAHQTATIMTLNGLKQTGASERVGIKTRPHP
jgi:hypothetical protein